MLSSWRSNTRTMALKSTRAMAPGAHYDGHLRAYGVTPVHRRSFLQNLEAHRPAEWRSGMNWAAGAKQLAARLSAQRRGYERRWPANYRCRFGEIDLIVGPRGAIWCLSR